MEDTHEEKNMLVYCHIHYVLILIVMEDTHEDRRRSLVSIKLWSLNPYCNGRYS